MNSLKLQKYKNGTRVKVLVGHLLWSNDGKGNKTYTDIQPWLKDDIATVLYTYGSKAETDSKYSKGEHYYKTYCLKFDNNGTIAWFDEEDIVLANEINMTDLKKTYKKIEEEFFKKLETKTSWGKNELRDMYNKNKADVLEEEMNKEKEVKSS